MSALGLSAKEAQKWITAFEGDYIIRKVEKRSGSRNKVTVWERNPDYVDDESTEGMF